MNTTGLCISYMYMHMHMYMYCQTGTALCSSWPKTIALSQTLETLKRKQEAEIAKQSMKEMTILCKPSCIQGPLDEWRV